MNEYLESEFVGRIAQLQFLNRSKGYQLNLRQRIGIQRSEGVFDNLNTLLTIDLKEYAEGKHPFPHDARQRLQRLETELIWTCLFSKSNSDTKVAKSIISAIIFDQLDNLSIARHERMPIEFCNATWLNLYRAIDPSDRQREGQYNLGDARRIFRFVKESECRDREVARVVLGLMTFMANRFQFTQSKQMLLDFVEIAKVDRELFNTLTDTNLLKSIVGIAGSAGVRCWLESVIELHRCREWSAGFGQLLSHLIREIPDLRELQSATQQLRDLARHDGISTELVQLLRCTTGARSIRKLLELCAGEAGLLSADAQAICCSLLRSHPTLAKQIARFGEDISRIGLDRPLKMRLINSISDDQKFAMHLASRRLETAAMIDRFRRTTSLEDQFYWLILIALQNLKDATLDDATRGISMLHRLRRTAKIDEHHYQLLLNHIAEGLPESLELISDDGNESLQGLLIALHVAAEELHSPKITAYFSDTIYRLNKYDRGISKRFEQRVGPEWVRKE